MADLESLTSPVEPIHVIPGRARFRVSGLYHCPASKHPIERELASRHQIKRVSANPLTGNVLVEFDKQIDPTTIATLLEEIVRGGDYSICGSNSSPDSSSHPSYRAGGEHNGNSRQHSNSPPSLAPDGLLNSSENGWHRHDVGAVAAHLESSNDGFADQLAENRLQAFGPNRLPEIQVRSSWTILLDQFDSMPTVLLLAAAGISIFTGGLSDALAIGGVLAINAAIGFFTESESESAIRSLKRIAQPMATVTRNGKLREVASERVVPGDIIELKPGIYVCADSRVLEVEHLTVDESALTGEGLPVAKTAQTLDHDGLPLAERRNMVYMGTRVTGGRGRAIVVATGPRTELGLIHRLAGETESPETPIERRLSPSWPATGAGLYRNMRRDPGYRALPRLWPGANAENGHLAGRRVRT